MVLARDDERVPLGPGVDVHEREGVLVLVDDRGAGRRPRRSSRRCSRRPCGGRLPRDHSAPPYVAHARRLGAAVGVCVRRAGAERPGGAAAASPAAPRTPASRPGPPSARTGRLWPRRRSGRRRPTARRQTSARARRPPSGASSRAASAQGGVVGGRAPDDHRPVSFHAAAALRMPRPAARPGPPSWSSMLNADREAALRHLDRLDDAVARHRGRQAATTRSTDWWCSLHTSLPRPSTRRATDRRWCRPGAAPALVAADVLVERAAEGDVQD